MTILETNTINRHDAEFAMRTTTTYHESAEMCLELAEQAETVEERRLFLKLAATWDWIARDHVPFEHNVSVDQFS